jgi:hypothetical protein
MRTTRWSQGDGCGRLLDVKRYGVDVLGMALRP